jgi:hypothetical protein
VDSSYIASIPASRWRTATLVASALAALEFAVLLAIGVTVLGRSVAHNVQNAAYAKVSGVKAPRPPKPAPPGKPKLTRARTDVLVLNGSGVSGAAGSAAAVLRRRGYLIAAVGNAQKQSNETRTLVMYRSGYRAEGARLARDAGTRLVSPLDGMKRSALMGAHVVLVVGH